MSTKKECKIPMFASHQIGVAGVVYRADTKQLLMVKDRLMRKQMWKFPGGCANLGEDLENTAIREVFEETGIDTKFASVLGFRQQHNHPGAFGRSDMFICCRLEPLSYEINKCEDEIVACEWIGLEEMCEYGESELTRLIARSIRKGVYNGFGEVDVEPRRMDSIYKGRNYKYFYRNFVE